MLDSNKTCFLAIFCLLFLSLSSFGQDTTPPVFDDYEPEISLECSDLDNLYVTATDDSGDPVTITYSDDEFSGGCVPNILRTYYAEDSSGNISETIQVILVDDFTPPIFMGVGSDMIMSCEEEMIEVPDVIVYDECQAEEIEEHDFVETVEESICETVITWTWTATDFCGNTGSHTKTITIVDETAPVFTDAPENIFAYCEEGYPDVPEVMAEDNCNDVTISFSEEMTDSNDETSYCTGQDVLFNSDQFSLKLIETPAQENYSTMDLVFMQLPDQGEGSTATLSGNVYGIDNPNAGWYVYMEFENGIDWDAWTSQDFNTSYKDDFEIAGDNYLDWTYFLLNSDNSEMIGLGDYEGSELTLSHNPSNYYYGFQLGDAANNFSTNYGLGGWFQATGIFMDASSSDPEIVAGIDFDHAGDVITDLVCCPLESLVRTWVATDDCGNSSMVSQIITLIDIMSPVFTYVPEDLLLECSDEIPLDMAEATDACGEVEVTYEDEIVSTECEGVNTINRTFKATDECGLSTWVTQIITIQDTEAPTILNAAADLVIDCEAEIPAPANVMAIDACDSELDMTFSEEIIGDLGPEGAMSFCSATTPIEAELEWSLIMFNEELGDMTANTVEATYAQYEDEGEGYTASIEALLVSNQNPNAGWELSVSLVNGMNWEDWSNQVFPTSYKDDLENSNDYYEDWTYFILDYGQLTGWGDWEGTSLSLSHAPENHYYGFQLGTQGANVNAEYGIGGWIHYSGTMVDENTDSIITIEGAGDLAFDLDCCPTYSVVRTWDFTDCSGNTSSHAQTITFSHIEPPALQEEEQNTLAGLTYEEIINVNATPNPMNEKSIITIDSEINTVVSVSLYTTQGVLLRNLFEGEIDTENVKEIELKRENLPSGIYIVKLTTLSGKVTTKIIIGEEH